MLGERRSLDRIVGRILAITVLLLFASIGVGTYGVHALDLKIPLALSRLWIAGVALDAASMLLVWWSASRRRLNKNEALVALPFVGWLCYAVSAVTAPGSLLIFRGTDAPHLVVLIKLLEFSMLCLLHYLSQFELSRRICGAGIHESSGALH